MPVQYGHGIKYELRQLIHIIKFSTFALRMSIIIRRARKEDCSSLLALVKELAEYEKASEEVTITLEHFTESGFGNNPVWWAFVAEECSDPTLNPSPEGRETPSHILGCALYFIQFSTWQGQKLYLEDIVVSKDNRGKGIGKMLFERVIKEAKEKQLNGMVWQVLDWNEPAISFYKKYPVSFDATLLDVSLNL